MTIEAIRATRGTTNRNDRGNTEDRRRRREWLLETYRADEDVVSVVWADGSATTEVPITAAETWATDVASSPGVESAEVSRACRCYRCGELLTVDTVTVDRIIPGCQGGTYRRTNIRPACGGCNSETGGALAGKGRRR